MNFSTGWIKLARVANNQAVAYEGLIRKYFPHASGFNRTNLRKNQERKDAISAEPKQDVCTTPPPLFYQQLKHSQRTKNNKIIIPTSLSLIFLKNKYSILTVTEFRRPVL